jgi:hypothetical protein
MLHLFYTILKTFLPHYVLRVFLLLQEIYFTKRNKHSIHHNLQKVSE